MACRNKIRFQSREEDAVVAMAEEILGAEALRQHTFPWLVSSMGRSMFLDAYFPSHRIALEYDGRMHREFMPYFHPNRAHFRRVLVRDREKNDLLAKHGVALVRIRDDEPRTLDAIAARLGVQLMLPLLQRAS